MRGSYFTQSTLTLGWRVAQAQVYVISTGKHNKRLSHNKANPKKAWVTESLFMAFMAHVVWSAEVRMWFMTLPCEFCVEPMEVTAVSVAAVDRISEMRAWDMSFQHESMIKHQQQPHKRNHHRSHEVVNLP